MRKMIVINIDEKLCKGCYYCVEICPRKVLGKSEELSPKGYLIAKAERPEDCVVCSMCERTCPDFAISVNEESKDKEK